MPINVYPQQKCPACKCQNPDAAAVPVCWQCGSALDLTAFFEETAGGETLMILAREFFLSLCRWELTQHRLQQDWRIARQRDATAPDKPV